jgi:hypothetical protein
LDFDHPVHLICDRGQCKHFCQLQKEKGRDHWTDRIRHAGEVMRDPWKNENEQMAELSEKVKTLAVKPKDKE